MKTLRVELGDRSYSVKIGNDLLADVGRLLTKLDLNGPPIIVSNSAVLKMHGGALLDSVRSAFGRCHVIRIGNGERYKDHATLLRIYEGMLRAGADRRSWILAFGGGVIGDIAGFAAATFMRGVPYASVPTTLLAQVDSSVGGKVAINLSQGKNLVGAFHQPRAVFSDTGVLKTLPERELASGLFEVLKCGAIRSVPLLDSVQKNLSRIRNMDHRILGRIILEACSIKAQIVSEDETEGGVRMLLNYGHTVGHALEAATDYRRFKHGEAVAWGMIAALGFGRELGLMREGEVRWIANLIHSVESLPLLKGISLDAVWRALQRDKKFSSGGVRMILLSSPGSAEVRSDIDPGHLRRYLKSFLDRGGAITS